jgi:ribose transport system permease protein
MLKSLRSVMGLQQSGLLLVIVLLGLVLWVFSGRHAEMRAGPHGAQVTVQVHNFYNAKSLMDTATEASFFAIMAVGATMVIISGGIDLSVGAIYALSGVLTALALRAWGAHNWPAGAMVPAAMALCLGTGLFCGWLNGQMAVGLRVHPFIITLGTMWVFRGIAFVSSKAESVLVPEQLTRVAKASLGLRSDLRPVPLLLTVLVAAAGALYLTRTVMGRHVYAVGGNPEASRFAGLRLGRIYVSVYMISGLMAGLAALLGSSYYGAAACGDAEGYELYVIASAVVGGASLAGGRGSAVGAVLGALLIVLIRQSIRQLNFDTNYTWIIVGVAVILAVVLDQLNARLAARRLAQAAAAAREKEAAAAHPGEERGS